MTAFWWLLVGLLAGWLIELAIDYWYWRRQAQVEAARIARQDAALAERSSVLDQRESALTQRDEELSSLQAAINAKDADLLAQAKRIDERAEEVTRLEQSMDKRRADLERMGQTLNAREKDIGERNEALKPKEVEVAARTEKLDAAETDVSRRVSVVSNRESAMQNWEARILAREHEVGDRESELVRKAATAEQLSASLEAVRALLHKRYQTPEGDDNLQAIEGVGPKIASLLHNADIRTFERLSETSVGELSRLLEAGGSRFGLADPMSWAEQAGLLVVGDYVGFEQLKEDLIGGVRRDAAALQQAQQSAEPSRDSDRDAKTAEGDGDDSARSSDSDSENDDDGANAQGAQKPEQDDVDVEGGVEDNQAAHENRTSESTAKSDPD